MDPEGSILAYPDELNKPGEGTAYQVCMHADCATKSMYLP